MQSSNPAAEAPAPSAGADIHSSRILILDFGSQYTQLIARRVRELGVFCEIKPFDIGEAAVRDYAPSGIILSGGPESVHENPHFRAPEAVFELGVPVLGICYGMQAMAEQLGGAVAPATAREFGHAEIEEGEPCRLFHDLFPPKTDGEGGRLKVWMSHGDHVTSLPPGFSCAAATTNAPIAAMADESRRFYGVQFHPEVTHTPAGGEILSRFLHEICGCGSDWTPANIIVDRIRAVHAQVGAGVDGERIILALSGGVDSSVVAALLHEAIGDRLICIFVDHGLLRLNEAEQVLATFAEIGVEVNLVNAKSRFMTALAGISDPEVKRKIIGNMFIEIFEEQAEAYEGVGFLAQGTIYPDVIESAGAGTGKAHVIKSHHNVGGLPERMRLQLVEPLRELFKDEVRKVGLELGLPSELVFRHPFPGPGLGVRILGEIKQTYADVLRRADDIFIQTLRKYDLYDQVSQAFAVYLPVSSVGVMGDQRRYEHVIAIRAVETVDFMTARWAHLPYELLDEVSSRIINEVEGVSRVTYDISGKPPATIEWE